MDYMRIIRRSFEITWFYRALWVFGFILALTSPSGGGGNGGGGGGGGGSSFNGHPGLVGQGVLQVFEPQSVAFVAAMIIIALLLGVAFTVARVVAETALIRMVNDHEDSGLRVKVSQGFRLGWSRSALRIFLIDLLGVLVVAIAFLLIFAIAAAPLASLRSDSNALKTVGTASGVFLLLIAFALFVVTIIALSVLFPFFHRACVLEGQGVFASFRRGWAVFRSRTKDTIIMTLALFCIGLAILPVVLLLLFGGATLASLPGLAAGLIASLFLQGEWPVVIGMAVGLPILILIVLIPILFLSGLGQVFASAAWTLTYRDILSLTSPRVEAPAA